MKSPIGLVRDYVWSLETIRYGCGPRGKLTLLLNSILHASFPLSAFWYESFGRPLFEPRFVISSYMCTYRGLVFLCPGGHSEVQFSRKWEPGTKAVIEEVRNGDAVDVGANIGLYTLTLSRKTPGRVLSIEADPTFFHVLRRNVQLNKCRNVTVQNIAAWSANTSLSLHRHIFAGPSRDSYVDQKTDSNHQVGARPLDEVFDELGIAPRFVKIDVEGAEEQVLLGMMQTLRAERPTIVFEALNGQALERCNSLLGQRNYDVRSLHDGNFLATPRE